MKDLRPYRKEGPRRRGVRLTELSDKQAKPKWLKNRSRLSPISVLVPLAFIFCAFGAMGEDHTWQISASIEGNTATLKSIDSSTGDSLVYDVGMPDGALRVSHTDSRGQGSEVIFRLQRVVVVDNDDGTPVDLGVYQIADSTYSAKTYSVVLDGVDGQGLEVEWHLGGESDLELHLELFDEKLVHDGVEYGPASALMRFELNYPEEGFNLEISLEAEVLTSQEDLSWQVGTNFVEISSSLPSSVKTVGLGKEAYSQNRVEVVTFSHEQITDGIAFTANFNRLGEMSWDGFFRVGILPFDDGDDDVVEIWHPSVNVIAFGVTAFFTAVAVTLLKLRFSRL
jgi:hypothetical protein